MFAFVVSTIIGIIIWFAVQMFLDEREEFFESQIEEVLVTSKYIKGDMEYYVVVFYKGMLINVQSDILYEYAKINENIKVGVKSWYIDGKCKDFEIIPLDDSKYCELDSKKELDDDEIFEDE